MKKIEYDVLFVGGGISSLSAAHRLVDLAKQEKVSLRIAIFEKGKEFGSHILSGAVSNPRAIKKLFPDYETNGLPIEGRCSESRVMMLGAEKAWEIPSIVSPPEMNKQDYLILSLSNVVKWMASNLIEKIKDSPSIIVDLYNGFPATEVIYNGSRIEGVKVDSTGIVENDNCYSKVTVFGDKGFISRGVIKRFNLEQLPQKWAVGVKEVWETENDFSGRVWHTIGYPLLDGSFGGGFIYGLKDKKIAIGMIAGLDSENPALHPPQILQNLKKHPWVQGMIKGGKILKYGAALIPEGGYYSLPREFSVDGGMLIGDALGILNLKGFSGIDKSMESGMTAADIIFDALQKKDFSISVLGNFKKRLMDGWVGEELYSARYYRYAFHVNKKLFSDYLPKVIKGLDESGIIIGFLKTFMSDPYGTISSSINLRKLMSGKKDIEIVKWEEDKRYSKADFKAKKLIEPEGFNKNTIYSTADVVFYASTHYHHDNRHIDEFSADVCKRCIIKYHSQGNEVPCVGDCTAEVHQIHIENHEKFHFMNLENCVQCRTCEIVCPEDNLKVNPAEHGSGPDFSGL